MSCGDNVLVWVKCSFCWEKVQKYQGKNKFLLVSLCWPGPPGPAAAPADPLAAAAAPVLFGTNPHASCTWLCSCRCIDPYADHERHRAQLVVVGRAESFSASLEASEV